MELIVKAWTSSLRGQVDVPPMRGRYSNLGIDEIHASGATQEYNNS